MPYKVSLIETYYPFHTGRGGGATYIHHYGSATHIDQSGGARTIDRIHLAVKLIWLFRRSFTRASNFLRTSPFLHRKVRPK